MSVTKYSLIGDVLDNNRETAQFFLDMGMHCLGCPSAQGESLEEACFVHGIDPEQAVNQINEYLAMIKKGELIYFVERHGHWKSKEKNLCKNWRLHRHTKFNSSTKRFI